MRQRPRVAIAMAVVVAGLLVQTTFFKEVRPLNVAPDLVLLVVIAAVRWLEPEPAVLLGFTAGFSFDLLGLQVLGLRSLVFTLIAYIAVRTRERFDVNVVATAGWVFSLSLVGVLLVAVIGTLFGEAILAGTDFLRRLLLVPTYNVAVGFAVLPLMTRLLRPVERQRVLM